MSSQCKTCKYAEFPLTPTGRIKRTTYGKCTVTFVPPPLPACINQPYWHRHSIWPDDGANCPTYEPK
jgi:hypothetical protein